MKAFIHPHAVVSPDAIIEQGVWIGPKVIICGDARIGAYSVIGSSPEHHHYYNDFNGEKCLGVLIFPGVRIFEFVTIHAGTIRQTIIRRDAAIFNKAHIAHDSEIEECATVGGSCTLAGHTVVQQGAILSGMSCTLQRSVIGAYAFVGGNSFVTQHIPPGEKWMGSPARPTGHNEIGLQRAGLSYEDVQSKFTQNFIDAKARK